MNSVMVSMVIIIIFFLPKDQVLLDRTLLNLEDPRKRKIELKRLLTPNEW